MEKANQWAIITDGGPVWAIGSTREDAKKNFVEEANPHFEPDFYEWQDRHTAEDADPLLVVEITPELIASVNNLGGELEYLVEFGVADVTPKKKVKILESREGRDDIINLIKEKFNCGEANIDKDGDVWIEDPQVGHWLDDEGISRFLEWVKGRQSV